ncbi:hypothetical protein Tco_0348413 [Tanacetum coccineum]
MARALQVLSVVRRGAYRRAQICGDALSGVYGVVGIGFNYDVVLMLLRCKKREEGEDTGVGGCDGFEMG